MSGTVVSRSSTRLETVIGFGVLFVLALIPTAEAVLRGVFRTGLTGSDAYIKHLVLFAAFVGGMITSAKNRHLAISVGAQALPAALRRIINGANGFFSTAVVTAFVWSSLSFVFIGLDADRMIGIIPVRVFAIVMPIGFAVMAVRALTVLPNEGGSRLVAALGFPVGTLLVYPSLVNLVSLVVPVPPDTLYALLGLWDTAVSALSVPLIVLLVAAGVFGTPIFVVLGGAGMLLFARTGGVPEIIPNEAYALLTGTSMPAIPLFTFAGFILSESKAGERLVRLFRSLLGWVPGGIAVAAILVSAFFTTFTGASGVTILALGGLLSYVLMKSGRYTENFTTGLLTSVGSIGLLFPPSLPIILYGVSAQISILDMFKGGILPGAILVLAMTAFAVTVAVRSKVPTIRFDPREAFLSVKDSILELLLPVVIVVGYFAGLLSIVETGAVAVMYALLVEVGIHRELKLRDLPRVAGESLPIIGGVLIILALARGLSYYIVDMEVPMLLSAWVETHIHSRFVFLLLLNLALLVTGCFMDIFSAILIVVPLIVPLGALFGIHPVHLGVIFLMNMELGFLTPPVGLNLFLSSFRFEKPLVKVYSSVVPFLLIQLAVLLLITYAPWFSTVLIEVLNF